MNEKQIDSTDDSAVDSSITKVPPSADISADQEPKSDSDQVAEVGGRTGLDPTRYGDWEKNGRCIDF